MELDKTYPDMSTGIKAIRNNNADLAAYLSDPDSVCTLFVPTNKVCQLLGEGEVFFCVTFPVHTWPFRGICSHNQHNCKHPCGT
jgi:hypothetical protein